MRGVSPQLIQSLQAPAAYPHPVRQVELMETHISWVLLTGEFAYKLKKPVDLGFVDFTTLERRKFFCGEELRLNRRLAPQLYLDVVPITGNPEKPVLGGEGPPIEFAVRMRQFPQDALLSAVLARGELTRTQLDELAREVAGFHARIEVVGPDDHHGAPEAVWQPVAENFRHLRDSEASSPRLEQLARLEDWSRQEFDRRADEFVARRRGGYVRECHGDMHLGNMVLVDGKITVFDCIEFNESLRWIDVQSEVAFLVMDLEDRRRPELAHRVLNRYVETTGDYAGLSVLDYYLCYRALVRAKVAALRCGQPGVDATEHERLTTELSGYLDQAERFTRRPRPMLMITHGPAGSGKTTGTESVVEALGAIRLRSDVERKRLHGLSPLERGGASIGDGIYSAAATRRTFDRLYELTERTLKAGFPTIVDATFLRRADRARWRQLAGKLAVPFTILNFHADPAELRRRVADRQQSRDDASDAGLEVLEHHLGSIEPIDDDERPFELAIEAGADSEQSLLGALRARLPGTARMDGPSARG